MNTELKTNSRPLIPTPCSLCDGTAWRPRDPEEPRRGVVRCTHGQGKMERIGPAVHRLIGSLENAALTPHDLAIKEIVLRHVGRANAIRGRDLAVKVWPDEMANPAKYESAVRRWLEESIYRLRRFGHLPIAASKNNPMGYYLPGSDQEGRECHDRLIREAIERLRDSQLFKRDADLMQELRGQLQLQESGVRSQDERTSDCGLSALPEATHHFDALCRIESVSILPGTV